MISRVEESSATDTVEGDLKPALSRGGRHASVIRKGGWVSERRMRLLADIESAPHYATRLKVTSGDRTVFPPVEKIDWMEAEDNYVILHIGKQTHIARERISALEAALDPKRFFR